MKTLPLQGKYALVTGASSGIGRAICIELARLGSHVLLSGRDPNRLQECESELASEGHSNFPGDLMDLRVIESLIEKTIQFCKGSLSILVHCAGFHETEGLDFPSPEKFEMTLGTNLRAPYFLTCGLLPSLRRAKGDIVFINSSVVMHPRGDIAAYAASKAGLKALADCIRVETSPTGVRVLSVYPGRTATAMQKNHAKSSDKPYIPEDLVQPEDIASTLAGAIYLGSASEITEIYIRPRKR